MVIALITDFGTRDYFVGAVKGRILTIAPGAAIIDITHDVDPGDIAGASFTLRCCRNDFPPGTVFLGIVDPGVGSCRRPLAIASAGCFYVGPDNGLFGFAFEDDPSAEAREIIVQPGSSEAVSQTFHGRDIFAPAAARLVSGCAPEELGPVVADPVILASSVGNRPCVIHIDRFGNLVTSLSPADLPSGCGIAVGESVASHRVSFYEEGSEGELVIVPGSAGFLELSVRGGSAKTLTGAVAGIGIEIVELRETGSI